MGKNFRRLIAVFLIAAISLTGCAERRTSAEKRESHRRGHREETTAPTAWQTEGPPEPTAETVYVPPTLPEVTEPTRDGPLIYDGDKPDYAGRNPEWELMHFEWESHSGAGKLWIEFYIDVEMYRYYRSADRIFDLSSYHQYINDSNNRELIKMVVSGMRQAVANLGYDDADVAREIAAFVQDTVEYVYDDESTGMVEYPRYPVETLYERHGDCEDTSILMAAMLKEWGYEVGLLHLPGHIAVAIRTTDDYDRGSYYEFNGHRYLYIESTGSGFHIGEIPEQELQEEAELYLIP